MPSQHGCLALLPQEHHQYVLPASTSTAIGAFAAMTGQDDEPGRGACRPWPRSVPDNDETLAAVFDCDRLKYDDKRWAPTIVRAE